MKCVTREKAKVDRIACPWLIKKFVDRRAEFLYVPVDQVMEVAERESATPYDVPGVELGHHGEKLSFDAFIKKYKLDKDQALVELAKIVRGADSDKLDLTPQSGGLDAKTEGFRQMTKDDFENMSKQFPVYDALYAYCKWKLERGKHYPPLS
jgi:hypothetical protein